MRYAAIIESAWETKQKRRCGQGVEQKRVGKHLKGVGLPRGPQEISELGTCMLLMNYLTQNQFSDENIKVIRNYDHGDRTI